MKIEIGIREYLNFNGAVGLGANPVTWFRIIYNYRGQISWQFIPKICFVTFIVLLSTPLIWWERFRYNGKIKHTKVVSPVFVIGHQRTGTTHLHYLLGRDPQFSYCLANESLTPWIFFTVGFWQKAILGKLMPSKRPMDNMKLGADLPAECEYPIGNMGLSSMLPGYYFPKRMYAIYRKHVLFQDADGAEEWKNNLKYFMQKLTIKNNGKQLVMKAPENIGRVKEILEVFPDAKFIHICRDPYTVYFSTERLYAITLPMVTLQRFEAEEVQNFIVKSYRASYQKFFKDKKSIPEGNLAEIRYEDFIGNELETLSNVYGQLGIDNFEIARPLIQQELKEQKDYRTNKYNQPEQVRKQVYSEWEPVFRQLGYPE